MRLARFKFLIVPIFFVFACVAAIAQQNSSIVGTVTDQTGAAVPGAKITLTQVETGFAYNSVSNSTGAFTFAGLNVGTYTLKASAKGFENYTASGLGLNVSQTLTANIKLTVGAETVDVNVTADALQVEADSNTVDTLISGEQVTEIATENRNFAALASLGLGVSSNLPDSNTPTSVAASFSISVNGLRESHNIWLIDGGEADDRGGAGGMDIMPSQDAIAQFEVLASNYPPDYGISSGATMSLALKSGTQKYHGEAYEFARNDAFDANNFFNKHYGSVTPVPKLRQNIFGGNLGGPLFIPHVYNESKRKTFFFYNQEWRRIVQGGQPNVNSTIPDANRPTAGQDLEYHQPLYAKSQMLYAPTTTQVPDAVFQNKLTAAGLTPGEPFKTDASGFQVIPASLFDGNGVAYLNGPLLPHQANSTTANAITSLTNPIDVTEELVRVDHSINDKWQILGHYIHDSVTQGYGDADLAWNWETYNSISSTLSNPSNSAAIKMSGTITPNLLVEGSFNYDGNIINITNGKTALAPTSGWTQNTFFTNSGSNQWPGASFCGGGICVAEQTGYGTWHNAAEDYDPKVDISYTKGKHAMKFGFGYNRYTKNQQQQADAAGDYSFGTTGTGDAAGDGNTGDPFMSMLMGLSNGYSQPQSMSIRHYANQTTSAYFNDNWKVSSRFSLQIGARYDALPHAWERNNALTNFEPNAYIQTAPMWNWDGSIQTASVGVTQPAGFGGASYYTNGLVVPGQQGVAHGVVTNDYKTFQPRVGFSFDTFGNGKTVLRGGFGTFYERMQGNDIYALANSNLPYEYTPSVSSVYYSNPYCSWNVANSAAPGACLNSASLPVLPASLTSLNTTYRAPAVAQYSFGVQHELKPSIIWVVQYVGNVAWHQNINLPLNNFPINTSNALRQASIGTNGFSLGQGQNEATAGGSNALRTYQGYGSITEETNTTNGNYNGFQTGLRVQNKWGLSGELDYTYSHEIDITSGDLSTVSNPWNLKYDKAGGSFDRRHILQANYIYKLPIFNKASGLTHSVLGGWELSGTFITETGVPFAAGLSNVPDPIALGGGYTNRDDVVSKVKYNKKVDNWFSSPNTDGGANPLAAPTAGWAGGSNLGFGNGRRDTFVGPGRVNFSTSLYKSFAFGERAHFEFRAESFNTFNHSEFNSIDTGASDGNYGKSTSTWDPRVLELGGKFVF